MKVAIVLDRDEITATHYPVVVEMWDRAAGHHSVGSIRRKFHATFTEQERVKARKIYNTFFRWYLRTGTPQQLIVKSSGEVENQIDNLNTTGDYNLYPVKNNNYHHVWTLSTWHLALRLIQFFGEI